GRFGFLPSARRAACSGVTRSACAKGGLTFGRLRGAQLDWRDAQQHSPVFLIFLLVFARRAAGAGATRSVLCQG
ncbi:hypothetical protein A2U01_0086358, partial [Trifolium medium]|nr:hypothetical protein [Trifolium medium]